jgi:16S rRNA (adenine1518-N6/adenine1519-N6)-dimethyltransferase
MNRAEVKRTVSQYGLHPSKKRGQNFLISEAIREKIVGAVGPAGNDLVLEIGPGLGSLTGRLIDLAGAVTAVEIDSGFYRFLREKFGERKNFTLIHADFLKLTIMDGFTKIVSNLPYCCSTEILFAITRYRAPHAHVMLQKELADRLTAGPGHDAYGALSVTMGFYYATKILFTVSREAFYPRPEVTSCFVSLARRNALALEGRDIGLFHVLVKSAFWGRRKTVRTALSKSPHLGIERDLVGRVLVEAGIDGGVRGEDLGLDKYIDLARAFRKVMG